VTDLVQHRVLAARRLGHVLPSPEQLVIECADVWLCYAREGRLDELATLARKGHDGERAVWEACQEFIRLQQQLDELRLVQESAAVAVDLAQLLRVAHGRRPLSAAEQKTLYDNALESGRAWQQREPVEMRQAVAAAARHLARLHRTVRYQRARERLMSAIRTRAVALRGARPRQRRSTRTVTRPERLSGRKRKRRRRSSDDPDPDSNLAAHSEPAAPCAAIAACAGSRASVVQAMAPVGGVA
jgi:hypothetical protein